MALELRRDDSYRKRQSLAVTVIGLSLLGAFAACWLTNWWFAGAPFPGSDALAVDALGRVHDGHLFRLRHAPEGVVPMPAMPAATTESRGHAALVPVPLRVLRRGVGPVAFRRDL